MDAIEVFVTLTYLSVALELILFPVSSVASANNLISVDGSPETMFHRRIEKWPLIIKLLSIALPTIISILTFIFPMLLIGMPRLKPYLINFEPSGLMITVGVFLIVVSRIASVNSSIYFGKNDSQSGHGFDLKTGNLFSYIRNPIVVSTHITLIGLIMIYPSYLMMFGALVYFLNSHIRILIEETFLKLKFGKRYLDYSRNVRRYGLF